jgi:hypothetical protein
MPLVLSGVSPDKSKKNERKNYCRQYHVGYQQEKIHSSNPAFSAEFGFRGGEMIENIRQQKQQGSSYRAVNSAAVLFDSFVFDLPEGVKQYHCCDGIHRRVKGRQKTEINAGFDFYAAHHTNQQ